jgi:hypothetical protein
MKHTSIIHSIVSCAISVLLMALISLISLLVLSLLTYLFKWQAPEAMIGIILTYILAGFGGGLFSKSLPDTDGTQQLRNIAIDSLIKGSGYMLFLVLISLLTTELTDVNILRILSIWLLIVAGYAIGRIVRKPR